jgi:endo-1,4-beta-D-glucanase Y
MNYKTLFRIIGVSIIVIGLGVTTYVLAYSTDKADEKKVFADNTMLAGLYNAYKLEYFETGSGRTLDKQQKDITTSEGQSYTMLRAVWQSDKPTFDKSWEFSQQQLQREDNLFSWRWGQRADGNYGVLIDEGGENTASDGDSDIALALVMAASRWQDPKYLDEAKKVINGMWEEEVVTVKGVPYLASNNLEKDSQTDAVINPSYFSPYAYRIFDKVDSNPEHNWKALVDSSYDLINKSMDSNLDKTESAQLVPDWVLLNKETGEISAPSTVPGSNLTTNYGYDAMRTAWRLGLDYQWNKESRAKSTLAKMDTLGDAWKDNSTLYAIYSHDGKVVSSDEPSEVYGTAIGYFKTVNPSAADEVYKTKLQNLYDANNNKWAVPMSYYSDNWTWFGMALHDERLPNLAEDIK